MSEIIDEFSFKHPDNKGYGKVRRLKPLSSGDEHFSTIEKLFHKGWKHPKKPKQKIHAVFKILSSDSSLTLYHRYRAMVTSSPALRNRTKNPANEQLLFHGTNRFCRLAEDASRVRLCNLSKCHLCSVIRNSFDVKRCGTKHKFRRFGTGIYTTTCSSKADDYVLNEDGSSKLRVLLVNRVIVGNPHKRRQNATGLTEPPCGHHSVVGEPGVDLNYAETVVYNNDAIRPAFLVVYGEDTEEVRLRHHRRSAQDRVTTYTISQSYPPKVDSDTRSGFGISKAYGIIYLLDRFQLGFNLYHLPLQYSMPQIEYLLVQEDQSAYEIHCPGLTSDLPDNCEVGNLIQEATADIRQLMSLDSSLRILVKVYTSLFMQKAVYRFSRDNLSMLLSDQGTKSGKVIVVFSLPRSQRSPYSMQKKSVDGHISREKAVEAARKRSSPSTGARNSTLLSTQKKELQDAIYNGRPISLTAPPIAIYHPVFATFQKRVSAPLDDFKFSSDDLRQVHKFVVNSLSLYRNESLRKNNLNDFRLVHDDILESTVLGDGHSFIPDGNTRVFCKLTKGLALRAVTSFTEIRNGIGEGGSDPIHQVQCDYVAYYSAAVHQPLRDVCCCPSFIIGISGPFMIISGAVFADRFISRHLTDYIYLGGKPHLGSRLYEIAKVLTILRECIIELEHFYVGLPPMPIQSKRQSKPSLAFSPSVSPSFPHFRRFTTSDGSYELQYTERLHSDISEKAVFKALIRASGGDTISTVVIKFATRYCQRAHQLLADRLLAPKLWFCDVVESVGMYVIVMDYIEGRCIDDMSLVPLKACKAIGEAIQVLHADNLVFGDLRPPNVILYKDTTYTKGVVLIDFEWCGEEGKVFYPPDLNEETIRWHEGVCPGGKILREHDSYMVDQMGRKGGLDGRDCT